MDHPLATLSPPPPPPPTPSTTTPSSLELSERASPTTAAAVPTLVKTTTRTPVKTLKPTVAKIPQTKTTTTTTPKKQASSSTLEEMANDFLSVAQEGITIPPKLRPPPLPKDQEGMERLRTLVTRRAWGDVLSVCGQMLRGPTSPYTQLYSTLISNADIEDEEFTTQQKDEMVEILTLECHAWLKLRRYNELGREVDKWNFLNTKESDASIPTWVPWSLRKLHIYVCVYERISCKLVLAISLGIYLSHVFRIYRHFGCRELTVHGSHFVSIDGCLVYSQGCIGGKEGACMVDMCRQCTRQFLSQAKGMAIGMCRS